MYMADHREATDANFLGLPRWPRDCVHLSCTRRRCRKSRLEFRLTFKMTFFLDFFFKMQALSQHKPTVVYHNYSHHQTIRSGISPLYYNTYSYNYSARARTGGEVLWDIIEPFHQRNDVVIYAALPTEIQSIQMLPFLVPKRSVNGCIHCAIHFLRCRSANTI